MSSLSSLMGSELPSEMVAAQQKSYVTFSTPFPDRTDVGENDAEPSITLLERRNLISGSQTTGFRTWEAALHLGSYLLTPDGQQLIRGKSVLELGAGTGFLSILCGGQLKASHVTSTDGDEGVIDALKENLFLNDLDDGRKILTSVLRWGHGLKGSWVQDDFEEHPYDTVIGADIVRKLLKRHQRFCVNTATDVRQDCHLRTRSDLSYALWSSTEHQHYRCRSGAECRDVRDVPTCV